MRPAAKNSHCCHQAPASDGPHRDHTAIWFKRYRLPLVLMSAFDPLRTYRGAQAFYHTWRHDFLWFRLSRLKMFRHPVAIAPSDIDHMGHVNNSVYLRWVQEAVVDYWESVAPC